MFLDKPFPYRTSFNVHTVIGLLIGFFLSFILIVLQPFGTDSFNHPYKNALLAGYGLIKFILYLIAHLFENQIYKKDKIWNWGREITFQILFAISAISIAYLYQEHVINQQQFSIAIFISFFFYIALPIFPIICIPTVLARYVLVSNSVKTNLSNAGVNQEVVDQNKYVELKGENNADILIVERNNLLFIQSIDNYVQVHYKEGKEFKKEILRSTLANIGVQAGFLWQPHRSYLINLTQDFKLIGNSQKAQLAIEGYVDLLPVARSSYKALKNHLLRIPKG